MGKALRLAMDESDLIEWYSVVTHRWLEDYSPHENILLCSIYRPMAKATLSMLKDGTERVHLKIAHSNDLTVQVSTRRRRDQGPPDCRG